MLKKVFSVLLVLCTLISVFALPVLAAESAETMIDRSADIARGEELGFGDFIDVEAYANNAGTPGYDSLMALRIDTPEIVKFQLESGEYRYSWVISIYFYNPSKASFETACPEDASAVSLDGYGYVKDDDDTEVSMYSLALSYPDDEFDDWAGYQSFDDMFFKASIYGLVDNPSGTLTAKDLTYYVQKLEIGGRVNSIYTPFEIEIDKTMQISGIDHKIDLTKPDYDLSAFYDVDESEILSQYPANDDGSISVAYLYEREYGTEDYGLYLYLYNPAGVNITSYGMQLGGKTVNLAAYMNFGGNSTSVRYFTVVSTSDTLVKLKCLSSLPDSGEMSVRDYFISRLCFVTEDGLYNEVDLEAHYEYSDVPFTDVEQLQFKYSYLLDGINLGTTFTDEYYSLMLFFDTDKEYSLYFSGLNGLEPLSGIVWYDEESCYAASSALESSFLDGLIDENGYLRPIYLTCVSDYPSINSPKISATVLTQSHSTTSGVVKTEDFCLYVTGYSCIGRSAAEAAVMSLFDEAQASTSTSKYMRSDVKGEIEIKCDSTFYRINSSASGTNYQQTLSTVGFALDASYFNLDDLVVSNDSYVNHINFTYREGYLKPAFVTTDGGFIRTNRFLPGSSRVELYNGYIYSGDDTVTGNGFTTFYPDFWFGPVPDPSLAYGYSPEKQYNYIPFVFMVQHEGDFEDFEYVLTQEEIEAVLEKFSEEQIFDGEIAPVDKTITFKDKTELLSYRDATFEEVSASLGFFSALWHKLCGMDDTVTESIGNINCIEMIVPDDYQLILLMSDEEFSSTYLVALNEAGDIKQKVLDALLAGQVYTFLRFDTYDYYASEAFVRGMYHDVDADAFIFQEKYYKDFDIIELGISNEQETVVYNVKMDPINIMAGATSDDEITKEDVTDPGEAIEKAANKFNDWWSNFLAKLKEIGKIAAIVVGVIVAGAAVVGIVRLVIYFRNAGTLHKMGKQLKDPKRSNRNKKQKK